MLQRAAIVNNVEALLESLGQRLIQIVDELGAFEVRCIKRIDVPCAQRFEDRFGKTRIGRWNSKSRTGKSMFLKNCPHLRRVYVQILTTEHQHVPKLDALLA